MFLKSHSKVLFLALVLFCWFGLVAAAPFQEAPPVDLTNLTAVLVWLAGAGGAYVTGQVFSYLAENWSKWHALPSWLRFSAPLLAAPLISVGATIGLQYGTQIDAVAPWWSIVSYSLITYLATQNAHVAQLKVGYGEKAKETAAELLIRDQEPLGRG